MNKHGSFQKILYELIDSQKNLEKKRVVILKKSGEFAIKKMNTSDVHGFQHVLRVLQLCLEIQNEEGGNAFILILSTLLHDVGRDYTKKNQNHSEISVKMTQAFFSEIKCPLSHNDETHVAECILAHSFSTGAKANSIEAKILSDADKLDALGAIGIYRASCFSYLYGSGLPALHQHFYDKLLLLPSKMYTRTGRKIANERIELMKTYISSLSNELSLKSPKTEE